MKLKLPEVMKSLQKKKDMPSYIIEKAEGFLLNAKYKFTLVLLELEPSDGRY